MFTLRHVARRTVSLRSMATTCPHFQPFRAFSSSPHKTTDKTTATTATTTTNTSTSESPDPSTTKLTMKEIQAMQAKKIDGLELKDDAYTEKGKNVIRGADGFLEYNKVPPPWKKRKGPYKLSYLLEDGNWIVRKSNTAHHVLGAVCVVFTVGGIVVQSVNPMLLQ